MGQVENVRVTDSVEWRLGKVTSKVAYIAKKIRPDRLLNARRDISSRVRATGVVEVYLRGPDGEVKYHEVGANLITDYGDEHIGERIALDAQDIVTGMRLGDQVTPAAASKAGAGAAIQAYVTGSNEDLDGVAVGSDKGAGSGWRQTHVCTWIAGDITNSALTETVLSDENPLTDVAGVVGDTVARFIFGSPIDKQAGDSLEVTWHLDILGA